MGFEVRTVERVSTQGSGHCSIGRDEGHIRSEAEAFQQRCSVGGAAASGDGNGYSGLLGGSKCLSIAGADGLAESGQ